MRRKRARLGTIALFAMIASAGADTITQQDPLLSTPAGWEFKDIGHVHYWSGEYTDRLSGAVVEFHISAPSYFSSICEADPEAKSVTTVIEGVPVCEMEFLDARHWGTARLKDALRYLQNCSEGSACYMDLESQLPPEGSGMVWIIFMPPGSVWEFTATYCTPDQRSRVLELLTGQMRLNLHNIPTTRVIPPAGASNISLQRTAPCGLAAELGSLGHK